MATPKEPVNIQDIAYDKNRTDYTIYIEEQGVFVPYFVIASDYGGSTLILREYVLETTMPYRENDKHMWAGYENAAYYEDSSIDSFLNSEFINYLAPSLQDALVGMQIPITAKSSLGVMGDETVSISRKVFLLSLKELNGPETRAAAQEGETIRFFADDDTRRVAFFENGTACPYWTRTPETWETYTVCTIGADGLGVGAADIESGVRPAFCLSKDTPVRKSDGIVDGQLVFVLAQPTH
jgi:hypothetical protein